MNTRAGDHSGIPAAWGRVGRDLITAFAVGLSAWSVFVVQGESGQRKDQTCVLFERQHNADVAQLTQTYTFLQKPPKGLENLVPVALAQLPIVETNAHASIPPAYCNEKGVGLPGPLPAIPKRPRLPHK